MPLPIGGSHPKDHKKLKLPRVQILLYSMIYGLLRASHKTDLVMGDSPLIFKNKAPNLRISCTLPHSKHLSI